MFETAKSLLEGLRSGAIAFKAKDYYHWRTPAQTVGEAPARIPVNYDPGADKPSLTGVMLVPFVNGSPVNEPRWGFEVRARNFFAGDHEDYSSRHLRSEYPGGKAYCCPRFAPSKDASVVQAFRDGEDQDEDFPRFELPSGCDAAEVSDLCEEINRFLFAAMPDFDEPSEAGALWWIHEELMDEKPFCETVYSRFCSLTAASLFERLEDGTATIEFDDDAPIDFLPDAHEYADPEDFRSIVVRLNGHRIFKMTVNCCNFWRGGMKPGSERVLQQGFGDGSYPSAVKVVPAEDGESVCFYEVGFKGPDPSPSFCLPAGCPSDEIGSICARIESFFNASMPSFLSPTEADEVVWLRSTGRGLAFGFNDEGELGEEAPWRGWLSVDVTSGVVNGRACYVVDGVDQVFNCPKSAGDVAKRQLITRLEAAIEVVKAAEVISPKPLS